MGSVYASCPDCGESIGGYWQSEVDGTFEENEGTPQEDFSEPFNLRLKRIAHKEECLLWKRWREALECISRCDGGKGYMPELAKRALDPKRRS
jgi:hypothetical protein